MEGKAKKKEKGQQKLLGVYDFFQFECRKGIKCFNTCCANVNIFLTPYDVLRMKNNLGISSEEFLQKYTTILRPEKGIFPVVLLRLRDDKEKQCYFVSEEGCQVYADRPWACRMFPLDKKESDEEETFFILKHRQGCLGFEQKNSWRVEDWIFNQEMNIFEKYESLYQAITEHERAQGLEVANPDVLLMVQMATYNLDKFRKFVFESNFLNYFDLEKAREKVIKYDDVELLLLGFDWLKFGLLGQQTLSVKEGVAEEKKKDLEKRGLLKAKNPHDR